MYIATVIPIARGVPFDVLTYYCSELLASGTLVQIPLGKQHVYGFVSETTPLSEAKTFVKQAAFSLKKIKNVLGHIPFYESVLGALRDSGAATLAPVASVAAHVFPESLFEYSAPEKFADTFFSMSPLTENEFTEHAVVGPYRDRADEYKRIIRSSFAAKKTVLFVAPTIRSLEAWKKELERGISRHVAIFHSKVSKKDLRSNSALLREPSMPLLIFATPGFSAIPIARIGTVIVEDENSNLYRSSDRYEIDARIYLRQFCRHLNLSLYWGDTIPRFETLYRTKADHLPRTFIPEKLHIVPIEHYRTILPSEVIELIRHAEKKKRKLFIYTNRKGVAPLSRCADCSTIVSCFECGLPMALRNRSVAGVRERFFVCLHCGSTLPATHTCTYCNSWNIVPVSIGTESIAEAVKTIVGTAPIVTIDDDLTPDSKTIHELIDTVDSKKFAIIIGTQKALPYIKKVYYSIIPFFDRLLSTPSLYTTEQALRLIMECNECSAEGVLVCTRNPDFPYIKQLETQKINAIIEGELALRRELGYPPFGSLIKISITVPQGYRKQLTDDVNGYLAQLDSTMLAGRSVGIGSMKVVLTWLLRVSTNYIEEDGPELANFLATLRFPFKIEENPDRI